MITSMTKLPRLIARVLNKGRVPMIHGSPGVGKSDGIRAFAERNNLLVIDVRLSQMTPTSLNGFGRINEGIMKSEFIPFADFPLETDTVPEGYDGWLLFLDELSSAVPQVQAAAYKIILDQMVGNVKIHPDCSIVAAGNKATDGAIVNRMGTAMQSRMVHFELEADKESWIAWANNAGIDYRVTAYVNFKEGVLNSFDPSHKDHTFACGRTLEFASDVIKDVPELTHDELLLLSGSIGEGEAKAFYGFCSIFGELPTLQEIIDDPEGAPMESTPNFMFGVTSFLAENMSLKNVEPLLIYMARFRPEYQAICARQAYRRDNSLITSKAMVNWVDAIGVYF